MAAALWDEETKIWCEIELLLLALSPGLIWTVNDFMIVVFMSNVFFHPCETAWNYSDWPILFVAEKTNIDKWRSIKHCAN